MFLDCVRDAIRAKQTFKNAVYRTIGEVGSRVGAPTQDDPLRVFMYHKVNNICGKPGTAIGANRRITLGDLDFF